MVDENSDRRLERVLGLGIFALTLVTYASVTQHEFVNYDDLNLIVHNPTLSAPPSFANLLVHFQEPYMGNWLPLYWISMQLGFALHGASPGAFLLTNVLLHAVSAVVLFAALRRFTRTLWRSAFVAAVFALHPLHVESVAWVVERKDVLAGFFWMLGLYAYSHYSQAQHSRARYCAVLLCLALGLMSKATLVTFPAVLLLLDVWPLDRVRGSVGRVLLEKLPMFLLVALASGVTLVAQRQAGNTALGGQIGLGSRLSNAVESYWSYLYSAVWPTDLAVLYPHPYLHVPVSNEAALAAVGLAVLLAGLTVAILIVSRTRPYLGVGWLWYLGTLVPMLGLVQVGLQARADRYMYLPLVGLSIMLAWGVGDALGSSRRRLAAALGGVAVVALALVTRAQLAHWENSIALFERAVAVTEGNSYAHDRLGFELLEVDRPLEARDHYLAAIEVEPGYGPLHYSLALAHAAAGDREAAIAAHRRALRIVPNMTQIHGALGVLLLEVGRPAEAKLHLVAAVRAFPSSAEYSDALARVRRELRKARESAP